MAQFPFKDFIGTMKDGVTKALNFKGETTITNDETNPVNTQLTGSLMEYYGLSTGTKPVNSSIPIGATFFEIDTSIAYMNDGTDWVII